MPECPPSNCGDRQTKGAYIGVFLAGNDDCVHKLIRQPTMRNPSIPIQSTENKVELADGSSKFPIRLPGIEKTNEESIGALLVMTPDGQIKQWTASSFYGKNKIVVEDGVFTVTEDVLSDIFDGNICQSNCNDVDAALGVKTIMDTCPGKPDKMRYQICLIPTDCDGGSTTEDCRECNAMDLMLAAGRIV